MALTFREIRAAEKATDNTLWVMGGAVGLRIDDEVVFELKAAKGEMLRGRVVDVDYGGVLPLKFEYHDKFQNKKISRFGENEFMFLARGKTA